jgi:hypothetical protein
MFKLLQCSDFINLSCLSWLLNSGAETFWGADFERKSIVARAPSMLIVAIKPKNQSHNNHVLPSAEKNADHKCTVIPPQY